MAYILNKTNGSILTTVQDASIDSTADLTFVGRNFAGYGEIQNENFLKLLENFANTTPPEKPIEGELWYDTLNQKINIFNGNDWKSISLLDVSESNPSDTKSYTFGDFWYNKVSEQLYVYNGTEFILIGPQSGADNIAAWRSSYEYSKNAGDNVPRYNIKAVVGTNDEVVAIVSNEEYIVQEDPTSDSYPTAGVNQPVGKEFVIKKGITLMGADPVTGRSVDNATGNNDIYFWGTAAHAKVADRATRSSSTDGFIFTATNTNAQFHIPFLSTASTYVTATIAYISTSLYYNPSNNVLNVVASAARYSDLAERYHADADYDEGTVLVIGGKYEVTMSQTEADVSVAGIVSVRPAYRMNENAGEHATHPFIALKGRVPCKVTGRIHKGDLIVTSRTAGHGRSFEKGDSSNAVFAKALESHHSDGKGLIEVMVV